MKNPAGIFLSPLFLEVTYTLFVKWFTQRYCFSEQVFEFITLSRPYIDMVIGAQQAGLEFPVRGDPEAVAECTELRVMERADNFYFSAIKAVFFAVMHPPGNDLF
jgi:hypothetical protein